MGNAETPQEEWAGRQTLISYNADGRWSADLRDYSDTTRTNSTEGLDQYGHLLRRERVWRGLQRFPGGVEWRVDPFKIVQNPDGSVDVNGDRKSNGVFMEARHQPVRHQYAAEAQGCECIVPAPWPRFTMTSDYLRAPDQHDRNFGISSAQPGGKVRPTFQYIRETPVATAGQYNTPDDQYAAAWAGSHIYTTQVYEKWPGDVESFSQVIRRGATAQNINLQFDFNNGGAFKGSVRGVRATASQHFIETDVNISDSDGCLWADPNSALPCGTFVYPAQLGGNRVFNANDSSGPVPITADLSGRNLTISMPSSLSAFTNPNGWTMKTLESTDDTIRAP
jgi:hypothetical protein